MPVWHALHRQFSLSRFAAFVAVAVVLFAGLLVEHQNRKVFDQSVRSNVAERLSVLRAELEGHVNANIQLVRGIVAVIATEPEMSQQRFAQIVKGVLGPNSSLSHIAGAPDMVNRLMYPLEGNEAAIGLDYRNVPEQFAAAIRTRDTGDLVIAGPLELVQGGQGLIGRYPVFIRGETGRPHFWGIVSAVIDMERLLAASGFSQDTGLQVAVRGVDGLGPDGAVFLGDPALFAAEAETMLVRLPVGSWQLAAVPEGGWPTVPDHHWQIRLLFVLAAFMIAIPILLSGRLSNERQRHFEELRTREHELERLSQRLNLALDASRIGIWEYDARTGNLLWDDRMKELYGLHGDKDVTGAETWREALHPDDIDRAEREFDHVVSGKGRYDSEFRICCLGGTVRHIRAIGTAYDDATGARRIVGVNWDVSADVELNERLKRARDLAEARNGALEQAKAQMEHNAHHDALTGLPNRRYLDRVLAAEGTGGEAASALLHIDLDRFKQINDTLGHAAGDRVLQHAAMVLAANARPQDFVARVGGDEFVVVTRGQTTSSCLTGLATGIIDEMLRPVDCGGQDVRASVSVGIATSDTANGDARNLLVNADIALYEAKNRGRNRYAFFTPCLQTAVLRGKRTADELISALERDEFIPFFQPQFDAATLEVVGVEALVRWDHPERGILPPAAFLDTAEEINIVATIDQRVLQKSMLQLYRWKAASVAVPKVSVNISSSRLHDENLVDSLQGLQFERGQLAFELLESTFLDDGKDVVAANVSRLKKLGVDIEIDDFGTGYASIISLLRLNPRRLKIDRQIIMPITQSDAQRDLVSSIIDMGKSLQIEVLAEGVETADHVRILRELGCHALQGFYFAKPMSANDLTAYLIRLRKNPGVLAGH